MSNKTRFKGADGKHHDVDIDVTDYLAAADLKLNLSQYYSRKYQTTEDQPTAFEQMVSHAGIRLRADDARGIPASSLKEIFNGTLDKSMGTIVRGDGGDRQTTTGRILFPEIMLNIIAANLVDNKDDYLAPWEAAIALKTTVTGARVDQPRIDITGPMASASMPIAQLAEPATMVSITLSGKSYIIPSKGIGLAVSDQALEATTIDLVGITMAAQARGERIRRLEEDMGNIISGDVDANIAATPFVNASTFDSAIPGTSRITRRAFVKWLRQYYQRMTITHVVGDIDAALDLDQYANNPNGLTGASQFNIEWGVINLGLPKPQFLALPTAIVGANHLVGFDKANALHQITNVSATYSAVENFVMRRATEFRVDSGVLLVKLYDEAFQGLTLGS
jgi:hypothetical protein